MYRVYVAGDHEPRKNLQVLEQTLQKDYENLQGRSAILDCVARDERARQFNVEIQGDNEGASPERARDTTVVCWI